MKVKELMDFNPEADITKVVTKEVLIKLENYKHELEHEA